ncbi:hypothetical protein C6Y53_18005 [Pukyongiella litopenaei]|uniref:CMD domain protein n=2 Tax=Pukyongiella litopenaei TaxID=2605946 RepID=A0A2S0MU47_9RHOB|nr:hypothetical protein C6Y53_18005 [Pukyongiella litopenaei]
MSCVAPGDRLAAVMAGRANVIEMTRAAEDAVLCPRETGGWSHDLRAALAARIARQNGLSDLGTRYSAMIGDAAIADLADPGKDGAAQGLGAVCAFMDGVSVCPRDVTAADLAGLQAAGISDADIVRLCEISAFMAYQARVIAGLKLMQETVA